MVLFISVARGVRASVITSCAQCANHHAVVHNKM
jgi:alkylhydroperoxidase family enzyme